mmetsp:Transcript_921/g.1212  ORF Transcript_921/g.1212 Transcript_921/m.1212 type:complete len:151 (+) Transcript_921:1163-1615(+)
MPLHKCPEMFDEHTAALCLYLRSYCLACVFDDSMTRRPPYYQESCAHGLLWSMHVLTTHYFTESHQIRSAPQRFKTKTYGSPQSTPMMRIRYGPYSRNATSTFLMLTHPCKKWQKRHSRKILLLRRRWPMVEITCPSLVVIITNAMACFW